MFYDFKAIKIMKRNKKIFDLSYWTGLYDQNCRNYHPFYIVGHTGPMVTRYTGGLSQLPVVKMSWGKKSKKKPGVLNNFCFLLNFESQILIDLMTAIRSCAFAAALKVSSFSSKLCTSQKIICHLCMHNVGWKDQTRFNA